MSDDSFVMNCRAVVTTLGPVLQKLEKLREALAVTDPVSAGQIGIALEVLAAVTGKHMITDNCDEWWGRDSEFWTHTMELYKERFGRVPALLYWDGTVAELDRLMGEAMTTGRRLTVRRLFAAQGKEAPLAALLGER